ncbi:hypothetical protein DFH09DRAFT_1099907 [Mycena vulgaris]|nr:hypothetical protein DFH09DRAFT_1099907 [Mycena vulgaris]
MARILFVLVSLACMLNALAGTGPSFLNIVAAPVRRAVIYPKCNTANVGASVGIDAARLKLGAINTRGALPTLFPFYIPNKGAHTARNLLEAQLSLLDALNGVTEIADSSLNSAPPAPADANQRIVAGLQAAQGSLNRVFAFDNTTKAAVTAANASIDSALVSAQQAVDINCTTTNA